MTHSPPGPIQLCTLADLLLICCDALRRPDIARERILESAKDIEPLIAAAQLENSAPLRQSLLDVATRAAQVDPGSWSDEYHRLFEGAMACPLNETAYVRRDKGAIIGDLCGFYRAFGLEPASGTGEKPDHLVTQLEFLALLLVMLAHAQGESRDITARAAVALARDHLCDWIAVVWERLSIVTSVEYYVSAAQLVHQVWTLVSRLLGFPPTHGALDPIEEPPLPYECIVSPGSENVSLSVNGNTLADDTLTVE